MVSEFFRKSAFSKTEIGKTVKTTILDQTFWDECSFIVELTEPILRLLRIVDYDEMPALGYVYEGYRRVEKAVMKVCGNSKIRALLYKAILGRRWKRNLDHKLIKAAYYFNPVFAYCDDWEGMTRDVHSAILDLIECPEFVAGMEETLAEKKIYDKREKMFARFSAKKAAHTQDPCLWWEVYGMETPILQKITIRLLSQTASSSGCERNWSVFERIHTKRRNRLEHKRLSDLVFVHYNMRLQHR
ncbi:hypothetical protein LINGRAPRIM_LOCUS2762 [Linum grandiflorum]